MSRNLPTDGQSQAKVPRRKFRPVFTLPGLVVLLIALVVLARSLSARNAYEIVLSSVALLLWIALLFTGLRSRRLFAALEPMWKPSAPPLTAASEEGCSVTTQAVKVPLFFRLHFVVRGRFFPQGSVEGCPVFAESPVPHRGGVTGLDLSFPLGGLFRGKGSFRLRDVFGFFSFPCGLARERTLNVRSSPINPKALRIDAKSGAEDRRSKTSSDEERYYMREYAPGDRFRDINWKSSERIDALITKISPDNQEKVTLIEVCFRNYGPGQPSMLDLWMLDRAKARLSWFLRSVKEEKSSYAFHVSAAEREWELKDQDEIESFLDELAVIPFSPVQNEGLANAGAGNGEIYVFSTVCDAALPAFFLERQSRPVSLFLIRNANHGETSECERLRLSGFPKGGSAPLPRWFLKPRSRRINFSNLRAVIDYAEIGL